MKNDAMKNKTISFKIDRAIVGEVEWARWIKIFDTPPVIRKSLDAKRRLSVD